jgi:alkyl hydroperoxide reductase subunit AhpF
MTSKDLECVYVGTAMNANYLKAVLNENNIGCIVRDLLAESSMAGFAAASPSNAAKVFVEKADFDEAEKISLKLFEDN